MKSPVNALALLALAYLLSPGPVEAETIARCADHVPNSYIVILRDSVLPPATAGRVPREAVVDRAFEIQQEYGGRLHHAYESTVHGFAIADLPEPDAERLARDPRVSYVEENCILRPSGLQQNPENWGLDRIDERNLPLDNFYAYNRVGWKIHIYVLDFFIHEHAEFEGRVKDRTDCLRDDGSLHCEHPASYTGKPFNVHGTGVAGVIASEKYGVAKEAKLHSVRVCTAFDCEAADVIAAVNWVRDNRIDPAIININLNYEFCKGSEENPFVLSSLKWAIETAINDGIVVVVSAGNCGGLACGAPPADTTAAIVVGATDDTDTRASWSEGGSLRQSNYGSCIDLFAPGRSITTTAFDSFGQDAELTFNGTSFASPHVAGIVALYLMTNPTATTAQVEQFLINQSTKNVISGLPAGTTPNRLLFSPYGNLAQ